MTFVKSRILITGGLGLVGSNLARRLVGLGANVTLVDSLIPQYGGNLFNIADLQSAVQVNICDVRDRHAMLHLLRDKDYLFNLAAQTSHMESMVHPQTDLEINVTAQLSLLEGCRKVNPGIKIVFASTRQLYGKPEYLPVDEQHPIRPVDINGINKLAAESYHRLYHTVYGIRACALRLTNTYGQGMRVKDVRQTFLGVWVRRLVEGQPLQVFGDGSQVRDFNHVDDCVDALLLAAQSEVADGKVYNLGSAEVISLKNLAEMMTNLGYGGGFELVPFPPDRKAIDIGDYSGDFGLINRELGWSPKVPLSVGLRKTVDFYRQHAKHYWE